MTICEFDTQANLIFLDMVDFNVIIGMNRFSPYHTILDYFSKKVKLDMPGITPVVWQGSISHAPIGIISYDWDRILISRGYALSHANICDVRIEIPSLDSITCPISLALYHTTLIEL